ncbi:hypothetical protein TNCT_672201 [Trichonephila clavata]|uniref:Nose resistant-to-fluoxetine protein N-terminal domain-containing protein n=1 Tax=Trichonephila clavata TaxID=2740835 RepID=A0A8X6HBV2_TRICU|nr:hypothetical protein TNCT_672201 [Trichonephila clavata]
MFSLIIFAVFLSACRAENDTFKSFQKLSELNEKWLQATSNPEVAMILQHPPYSYHSNNLAPNLNVSEVLLIKNETEISTTPEGSIKSCSDDLVQILYNLKSDWARQMIDSDGKLSSGLLRGGLIWPGHFEECNSVYAPKDDEGHGDFHGKYCLTSWTMNLGGQYSKLPLKRHPLLKIHKSSLTLKEVSCKLKDKELDIGSIIYVVFVSCFVILVLVGSAVTVLHNLKKQRTISIPYSEQNIQVSGENSDLSEASAIKSQQKSYDSCNDTKSLIQTRIGVSAIQRKQA